MGIWIAQLIRLMFWGPYAFTLLNFPFNILLKSDHLGVFVWKVFLAEGLEQEHSHFRAFWVGMKLLFYGWWKTHPRKVSSLLLVSRSMAEMKLNPDTLTPDWGVSSPPLSGVARSSKYKNRMPVRFWISDKQINF